ncbi:MAG: hypothetical protein H6519_10735 [Microthrixaceae bacterium]|nr:hypothetical protein [Microthrixaceae bacterium]
MPVGSVSSDEERADLVAELDAAVGLLYDLDEADLRVIYDTFHEGTDYSAHVSAVLDHYSRLAEAHR